MSLKNIIKNRLELNNNNINNKENNIRIITKKRILNIKKNVGFNSTRFNTIDSNNKEPLLLKEDNYLIKDNKYINYLNNIKINKEEYKNKDSELNYSKSNTNFSSIIKNIKPLKLNVPETNPLNTKKNFCNSPNYVKLNSLYTLPSIPKRINRYNSIKTFNTSNNRLFTQINIFKSEHPKFKNESLLSKLRLSLYNEKLSLMKLNKENKYNNLNSFMKFKYYEDVNEKMEKKLRDDSFIDRGVKDKIIKIGKFGVFWKNVMEYCSPLMYAEKYKNIKKEYLNKNSLSPYEQVKNKNNRIFDKVLYTNILSSKIIHNQSRNKNNI